MAYAVIYERFADQLTFIADSDSDVSTIETDYPAAPAGSMIVANNSGATKLYIKYPTGGFEEFSLGG